MNLGVMGKRYVLTSCSDAEPFCIKESPFPSFSTAFEVGQESRIECIQADLEVLFMPVCLRSSPVDDTEPYPWNR